MLAEPHPMFGRCPEEVVDSLRWYALRGRPLGGFLEAVIAGELYEAVGRADMVNGNRLASIVAFIREHMPRESYGSEDDYRFWVASGGLQGREKTHAHEGKPKIYCYSNAPGGGDGLAYAMAEDGTVLGSHLCSHEGYVPYDLGVVEGFRPDRHETYRGHYPDGYEMEFVPAADIKAHAGLMAAYERNQRMAEAAENGGE